jgi:hypothetical protein
VSRLWVCWLGWFACAHMRLCQRSGVAARVWVPTGAGMQGVLAYACGFVDKAGIVSRAWVCLQQARDLHQAMWHGVVVIPTVGVLAGMVCWHMHVFLRTRLVCCMLHMPYAAHAVCCTCRMLYMPSG